MEALALHYLGRAWETIHYFALPVQPVVAASAVGTILLFLLLRVYVGGFFGWLLRYVAYGGLFWLLITRPGFRDHFPPAPPYEFKIGLVPAAQKMAAQIQSGQYQLTLYIVAVILTAGLWLFVSIVGGIWRARRRSRLAYQPSYAPVGGAATAQVGADGEKRAFDVTRREGEKKQTMVIMMTDIKGYSARMEKDEAATFALLKEHNVIMRRAITTNRGREIKTIGDAFMVVFNSPIDAVRCGMAMQKELYAFNKPRAANDHLLVRIGIHQGEVIVTQKDVFGEGVNIAARMESITDPGGISISTDVYEAIKGKIEAGFQSVGIPKMKNIANPPEVFRVHIQHQ
jgi:class 3 adenylate cyclase